MMPLMLAEQNKPYRILKISGKDEIRSHLRDLGIVEKETISIKQAVRGNLIVEVKGIRIALSDTLAKRIQIGQA